MSHRCAQAASLGLLIAASPFAQLKGRLALPVRGELGNRFGSPHSNGGPTWKGLFIVARASDEVRAIAGGRVVFADRLRGFGNLLILDHGSAYVSLYDNNEALYKRAGDEIRGGRGDRNGRQQRRQYGFGFIL